MNPFEAEVFDSNLNVQTLHLKSFFVCIPVVISLYMVTFLSHRNNLAQLKDAYTKLFEDYNELKEDKKKKEVC